MSTEQYEAWADRVEAESGFRPSRDAYDEKARHENYLIGGLVAIGLVLLVGFPPAGIAWFVIGGLMSYFGNRR